MRALRRAREQGLGGRSGEEFDAHPNAIDLAFYAPPQSNKIFSHLARFVYALFLLLALLEGLWLSRYMVGRDSRRGMCWRFLARCFGFVPCGWWATSGAGAFMIF
jgi:hypothetical protein